MLLQPYLFSLVAVYKTRLSPGYGRRIGSLEILECHKKRGSYAHGMARSWLQGLKDELCEATKAR